MKTQALDYQRHDNTQHVLSVSELTYDIKRSLESQFFHLQVKGEVVNFKQQSSGHIYFTLKDAKAQISCAYFRGSQKGNILIKDGDEVIIGGEISLYAPRGQYQIIVRSIKKSGIGDLLATIHNNKQVIIKNGWAESSTKKALPPLPKKIGIVTSPTGAVIRDIIHVLTRRAETFHIVINPVAVQGDQAHIEIANAIDELNAFNLCDVIIVARGGGSLEDLMPFNHMHVVEAIVKSSIPIISSVGHETDHTLCDLVADVRAPTPSAAAEIVTHEKKRLKEELRRFYISIHDKIKQKMKEQALILMSAQNQPIFRDRELLIRTFAQKLDEIELQINSAIKRELKAKKLFIDTLSKSHRSMNPYAMLLKQRSILRQITYRLMSLEKHTLMNLQPDRLKQQYTSAKEAILAVIREKRTRVKAQATFAAGIHPNHILKKGFCIAFKQNTQSIIMSKVSLDQNHPLTLQFHDGKIDVKPVNKDV